MPTQQIEEFQTFTGPSDDGGWWFRAIWLRMTSDHGASWAVGFGADKQHPFRPWPVRFSERRTGTQVLAGIIWMGVFLAIQTYLPEEAPHE